MMDAKLLSGVYPKKCKLMGGHKWVAQIGKLFGKLLQVTKRSYGYWYKGRHIFISSLFKLIQHFQPIKGYLWIIVARIIAGSIVKN